MAQPTNTPPAVSDPFEMRHEASGRVVLKLRGQWIAESAAGPWKRIESELRGSAPAEIEIDATELEQCDGSGIALLHYLHAGFAIPGASVNLHGLRPEFEAAFRGFTAEDYKEFQTRPAERRHIASEVGKATMATVTDCREQIGFVGAAVRGLVTTLGKPRAMRWPEVWRVMELAGANAVPIVSLISLLVGLIIAFESAQPLARFGAQIFIADMIGLVMIRELGPLMTAILLAGRSSSAFAAEIGTMKVNEELNALETMGLDPIRFLVVQRIAAGFLLGPVLTLYSMLLGVAGGVIVMLGLGFSFSAIYSQLISSVGFGDILVGTLKGFAFGLIIAAIGCLRGLQTKKGPGAVGDSTTRAVVSSILLIILTDALFSVILYVLR
jgi:phospholipid/cholesterol/gamma-HCH transport system permease protein